MTTKSALLRYLLIDFRLRKNQPPGLEELKKFVEKEFRDITDEKMVFSRQTIKKDIKHMRHIFFAPIDFSFEKNQYYYQLPGYTFLKLPDNVLERLISNIKLQYIFGEKFNAGQAIQFETETSTKGWEYLPVIAKAIASKRVIEFTYKGTKAAQSKTYLLHPLLLKENRNTFYLIAMKDKEKEIRTFALDRIIGLPVITKIKSEKDPKFDAEKFFANSIGITAHYKKPIEITLSFTPEQADFLIAKPLHKSQKVILQNETEFRITLKVEPTYEVVSNILSYGGSVEVIEPFEFREMIADSLKAAYNRYLK